MNKELLKQLWTKHRENTKTALLNFDEFIAGCEAGFNAVFDMAKKVQEILPESVWMEGDEVEYRIVVDRTEGDIVYYHCQGNTCSHKDLRENFLKLFKPFTPHINAN